MTRSAMKECRQKFKRREQNLEQPKSPRQRSEVGLPGAGGGAGESVLDGHRVSVLQDGESSPDQLQHCESFQHGGALALSKIVR